MSKTILVVGAGQMGAGIGQVAAQAGNQVIFYDSFPGVKDKAMGNVQKSVEKLSSKGRINEDAATVMARVSFVDNLQDISGKDIEFMIEAITENPKIKFDTFRQLDEVLPKNCIFASNTSSISITKIAGQTSRPEKVIGMHFMNPVPIMKLVEIIKGMATDDNTFNATMELAKNMGKETIVAKDSPGFAVNRILMPWLNEAFFALGENLASPEDIDKGMKLGTNVPMGPLTLADFVGLDTCLAICEVLHKELGEDKYRPAPLLRKYVEAGWWGKKVGRGVYNYE